MEVVEFPEVAHGKGGEHLEHVIGIIRTIPVVDFIMAEESEHFDLGKG